MDPLTHTVAGAALARAGLGRATPLAAATLIAAANAPDIDVLAYARGEYAALALRRGWTHGPLAMALLPFAVAGAVLAYDRWVRRRRRPEAPPARPLPVLLLALVGVLTHPVLDWMNTYGVRWLMPLDRRWHYGDALFIVDPWLWLALGGGLFLAGRRGAGASTGWIGLAAAATALVLAGPVPPLARWVWGGALLALVALRVAGVGTRALAPAAGARWGLGLAALYIVGMVAAGAAARQEVRAAIAAADVGPVRSIMVAPEPANPLSGTVVIETPAAYRLGTFAWLERPRLQLRPEGIPILAMDPVIGAATRVPEARDFLAWSRFPFFRVVEEPAGYRVRIGDARYADDRRAGSLSGLTVQLDRSLRPVAVE